MAYGFFATVLIALVNSIDNLGAWIAFSLKGIRISYKLAFFISVITFAVSVASAFLGDALRGALSREVCSWLSASVLVGMGVWFIAEPAWKRRRRGRRGTGLIDILEHPEEADLNRSKDIDLREAALLGLALSLNNCGGSFSAGVIGLDPWLIGALCAVFSFGFLWVGRWVSNFLLRHGLADKAALMSGTILILLGIRQLF